VRAIGHVTYSQFLESLHISGTGKVRDFRFGVQIERHEYTTNQKNAKVGQKGRIVYVT